MSKRAKMAERKYYGNLYHSQMRQERDGFIKGYEQAEKDLALTWEDTSAIVEIAMDIIGEGKIHGEQNIYTEVLKRFNERREKK